ncbi:MAG: hypothetical protein IOC82_05920 [Aestuariivirga sp.]|uniref:hypothetical protein n=1 Tax=Aestuariivirga sp. TaxID=2650926 RepID=UPI0025BCC1A2|nr:hypothetical protein [Aestuariivirga sp.]MCA3560553.1 hypothetical protein [Aestuariivirga sp.]
MIRYALILLGSLGAFAAAAAVHDAPASTLGANAHPSVNLTVIAKNSAFPVLDSEGWIACEKDDCSDVPPNG